MVFDRSLALPSAYEKQMLQILQLRLVGLHRISHDIVRVLKLPSKIHLQANNVSWDNTMASPCRLRCHTVWTTTSRSPHVGQGSCANDLYNTVPSFSLLGRFIL